MSVFKKVDRRDLIPIWKNSADASIVEFLSLKPKDLPEKNNDYFVELMSEFSNNRTLGVGAELLNIAILTNNTHQINQVAEFILADIHSPQRLIDLAQHLIEGKSFYPFNRISNKAQTEIGIKRKWLKEHPKDSLSWIDLGRAFASIGEHESAKKSILTGLQLSNNNRWVTRVSSRFFISINEPDIAHKILKNNPNLTSDPWLLSAELAVSKSYGRTLQYWKTAKKLIDSIQSDFHLTELNSCLGSLELLDGNLKKAKPLFIRSLKHPNSNVLAQAKWAERTSDLKDLVDDNSLKNQKNSNEAKCWSFYSQGDMEAALKYALLWHDEEPYTCEPAILSSYLAALLDRYDKMVEIAVAGLIVEPDNHTLLLNKYFAEISLAEIKGDAFDENSIISALKALDKISQTNDKGINAHAYANIGFIFYKIKDFDLGREWYEKSINLFSSINHPSQVLAEINHLREALISQSSWAEEIFHKVRKQTARGGAWNDPAVKFYMNKLEKVRKDPENWRSLLTDQDKNLDDKLLVVDSFTKFNLSRINPTIWINNKKR
ncbi:hypothetical protein ACWL47_003996 [Yersinia enterocolitica]